MIGSLLNYLDDVKELRRLEALVASQIVKQKEKPKMTREEAKKKLIRMEHFNQGSSTDWLLNQLEALGLIKFDEPQQDIQFFISNTKRSSPDNTAIVSKSDLEKALGLAGYEIVKKKPF